MRTAVLPSDEASFKIHSVLKQTGVMWMKPDMQSWKPMQWFSQEFLNAEEPQVDGTCKPYARDISPLSARWEKCEWSETLSIAYFLIYVFAMFFDVACFSFTYVFVRWVFFVQLFYPHMLRMRLRIIYDYMDTLCMFMLDNSVLCRLRSSCYAVMWGTRSVYKVAVRRV